MSKEYLMKNLLFLTTALVAQGTLSAIDKPQILKLADTSYKLYVGSVLQAGRIPKIMGFVSEQMKLMRLGESPEIKELKAVLDASFVVDTMDEGRKIAEPVIVFAQALQAKLGNVEQIVKDFSLTDQKLIDQFSVAATNQVSYFEALKLLGLQHAYLYTLGTLTKEQQEIVYFAVQLVAIIHDDFGPKNQNIDSLLAERLVTLKKSSVLKKLQQEVVAANKLADNWSEAEKAALNVRFLMHLVELHATNKTAIVKKYNLTGPTALHVCDWFINNFDMRGIVDTLDFSV